MSILAILKKTTYCARTTYGRVSLPGNSPGKNLSENWASPQAVPQTDSWIPVTNSTSTYLHQVHKWSGL